MKKSFIVIHGGGGSLCETFKRLLELNDIPCLWYDGKFYIPKDRGIIVRKILFDDDGDNSSLFESVRKQIVASMLYSCRHPKNPLNSKQFITVSDERLIDTFPEFAIPFGPTSRQLRAEQLQREGRSKMLKIFSNSTKPAANDKHPLQTLINISCQNNGKMLLEADIAKTIERYFSVPEMIEFLLRVRDMMETGGDLDTVASAVFYARHLLNSAAARGEFCEYGRDYQFVFVNYHQGLRHLAESCGGAGDIYMADMPIATIPDLPGDLEYLRKFDLTLKRYEDHHPYNKQHLKMLNALKAAGLIEYFSMSGPLEGEEQDEKEMKCGADMVYESLLAESGTIPAMKQLKALTHAEDFASNRQPLGILLTELIKGGINKIELAQILLSCRDEHDLERKLQEKGWEEKIRLERQKYAEIADRYLEYIQMIEVERTEVMNDSGPAYGIGSDMPIPRLHQNRRDKNIKILVALAPKTERHEPKLNVGRACEYFKEKLPDTDYLLFCYGSSLIVGRRLNQADTGINLAALMKKLGTEEDGGHAGAAVCNPQNNPQYPTAILANIGGSNFKRYCRYLSFRLQQILETKVLLRHDLSVKSEQASTLARGSWRLLAVVVAAMLVGGIYLLLNHEYREKFIYAANKDFFPWICPESDMPSLIHTTAGKEENKSK